MFDLYEDEQFWLLEGSERDNRVRRKAIARSIKVIGEQRNKEANAVCSVR